MLFSRHVVTPATACTLPDQTVVTVITALITLTTASLNFARLLPILQQPGSSEV